MAAVRRILKEL